MFNLTTQRPSDTVPLLFLDEEGRARFRESAGPRINGLMDIHRFKARNGEVLPIEDGMGKLAKVLVGSDPTATDPRSTLFLFASLMEKLPAGFTYAVTEPAAHHDWEQAALGWGLASYKFSRYLAEDQREFPQLYLPGEVDVTGIVHQLEAVFLARDLINTPALDLGPSDLVDRAREVARRHGAEFKSIDGDALLAENFPAIHAVGMGSPRPPALIDLRWGDAGHPKVTLIGKGVIFDTGGLNLKNAAGMRLMKKDMGGAAVTLALADLIMNQNLPVRLRLLIPAVENSPGLRAFRPGDIIATRKGLSVEIGNTDAEGRVILCDALAEAITEDPDCIIDMATLTGACRVALGQDLPGFWTPDEDLANEFLAAARQASDPVWRMPLWEPYQKLLASPIADLSNMSSSPYAGAITAALYLHEFVKPFQRWIHLDAYCWRQENIPGTPQGGEASALRAVFRLLQNRYRGQGG